MSEQKQCPKCNTTVSAEADVCVNCGKVFRKRTVYRAKPKAEVETQPLGPPPEPLESPFPQPRLHIPESPFDVTAAARTQEANKKRLKHSPALAVILSLCGVIPGQIYNRQIGKAIFTTLAVFLTMALTGGWSISIAFVLCTIDAWVIAKRRRNGEDITQLQWF